MNTKLLFASLTVGAALAFTGCSKEEVRTGNAATNLGKNTVTLNSQETRVIGEAVARLPKLRVYNPNTNKFIDMDFGTRDYVFADADPGFTFDDTDGDGFMVYNDYSGNYIVYNLGGGFAGTGGSGLVIAGDAALNMDYVVCIAASDMDDSGSSADIFETGFNWEEFGAVVGISGDINGLMEADTESEDFDPFSFFNGYAVYYVLSDELTGNHDIFDWFAYADGDTSAEDFAFAMVLDFSDLTLYFANSGNLNVSGGSMNFNGTYLMMSNFFDAFLEGEDNEDPSFDEVPGYGQMGCN